MALRAVVTTILAILAAACLLPSVAQAQRSKFDGLRQCERQGSAQFRKHNAAFKRFLIDRSSVNEDRYSDQVGTTFVSTIYYGKALYEAAAGPKTTRFICLHGGYRRGAVFVYTLPE